MYDSAGNLTAKTDAQGRTTTYAYDLLNRLSQVIDADGRWTAYTYDKRDNLIALTDAEDHTTRFEYDRNNRLTKEIRPMGQQMRYAYDDAGNLIEKIAELVKEKRITGITDIRDESSREGIRVVLELGRGEIGDIILKQLYKFTEMETTFGVQLLAISGNQPKTFTLKGLLESFIAHRKEVILRRTRFDLDRARERAHVLEGLTVALDNLDAVITLIRSAKDPEAAKAGLMQRFSLSEIQSKAILDMRLQRLTGLERDKILAEYREVLQRIAELTDILGSESRVRALLCDEMRQVKADFANPRRTQIVDDTGDISIEELIADEEMVITVPRDQVPPHIEPEVGLMLQLMTDDGELDVTVTDVTEEHVTLDANHPLAGFALTFEIELVSVG